MLNSAHANYSYDSLKRILKFGLTKVDLTSVDTILLLGLGGGSVIKTLREDFDFSGSITAVELDNTIIDIAAKEFQIYSNSKLEIIYNDAFEFVKKNQRLFDLIIIDLFIDNLVPEVFYSTRFWENISKSIQKSGCFIFNASVISASGDQLAPMMAVTEKSFLIQKYELVEGTNTVVTGQKK